MRDLTEAERRVFRAYVEQETHERAAASLGITTQTLKNHLGSIYKKVGARKAHSALYRLALEHGHDPLEPLTPANPPLVTVNSAVTPTIGAGARIIPSDMVTKELVQEGGEA